MYFSNTAMVKHLLHLFNGHVERYVECIERRPLSFTNAYNIITQLTLLNMTNTM